MNPESNNIYFLIQTLKVVLTICRLRHDRERQEKLAEFRLPGLRQRKTQKAKKTEDVVAHDDRVVLQVTFIGAYPIP